MSWQWLFRKILIQLSLLLLLLKELILLQMIGYDLLLFLWTWWTVEVLLIDGSADLSLVLVNFQRHNMCYLEIFLLTINILLIITNSTSLRSLFLLPQLTQLFSDFHIMPLQLINFLNQQLHLKTFLLQLSVGIWKVHLNLLIFALYIFLIQLYHLLLANLDQVTKLSHQHFNLRVGSFLKTFLLKSSEKVFILSYKRFLYRQIANFLQFIYLLHEEITRVLITNDLIWVGIIIMILLVLDSPVQPKSLCFLVSV